MAKADIANCIRKLRFEHGEMTQQELADRAGCTRQTIIVLEHRRYVPSLSLAFRIAKVFGVPVDEVFQYEGEATGTG
ncbi:MAG: helix-turn-helix transcriptional regulator [Planctomycetota bacterium]|jgi:putative transcriptional regulator